MRMLEASVLMDCGELVFRARGVDVSAVRRGFWIGCDPSLDQATYGWVRGERNAFAASGTRTFPFTLPRNFCCEPASVR